MPLRRLSRAEALRVAKSQADRLLRWSEAGGPPLKEAIIAGLPHLQIERVKPAQAQAAAEWSHGRWVIILNGAERVGRQRWSLAHELKHILDHPFVSIVYARRDECIAEQACDYFAACLLMPSRWLRPAWPDSGHNIRVLARRFGVTPQAVLVRLLQLGLIDPTSRYLVKEA